MPGAPFDPVEVSIERAPGHTGDPGMSEGNGRRRVGAAMVLAIGFVAGSIALGHLVGRSLLRFKEYERTVEVKGLSEREVPADIVIWPIAFTATADDLGELYDVLARNTGAIREFLEASGIDDDEVTVSPPSVTDKLAQQYGGGPRAEMRYVASQSVTVYSSDVAGVRAVMPRVADLGRRGIALSGNDYQNATQYLFTGLNDLKPEMIEEATRKAREVAVKFAEDSKSRLGKIKRAQQGQFSISDRDKNTPHLKRVRVVSTIEYYLSD
jgi:hypothetical protein